MWLAISPEQQGAIDLQDVQIALTKLPPVLSETLILVAVQGLSYEEAAAALSCQLGTIKSRLWRASEQLFWQLGYTAAHLGSDRLMLSALRHAERA